MNAGSPLNEIMALRAALAQAEARADAAEADAAQAKAKASSDQAFIAYLKLEIEKLRRDLYGVRSERKARLLDQMELQLEELEATAGEDELAAEQAAAKTTTVEAFSRRKPARKPFPDHLPRERVVIPAPTACPCCGSDKLCRLGETITETLESIPRQWKVIQTVRGTVLLPGLRDDHPAAGTLPHHPTGLGRPQPAGDGAVREVRPAPTAEPAVRALCPRGCRDQPVHSG